MYKKNMKNLFNTGIKGSIKAVDSIVDKLSTSDAEKLKAKNEISKIITESLNSLQKAQRDVLITEMNGGWLQRSWRPILMLAFGFIVVYSKFLAPVFGLPNPPLEEEFWVLLEIGIGGFVIGRSLENVTDKVTRNVDLTFLKKKDRNKDL